MSPPPSPGGNLPLFTYAGAPRFRARAILGEGSLGLVYRAYDEETNQEVALKTLPRLDAEPLYQLKEEFRALAGIAHPNLVELYELVIEPGQCFFTMELVHGRPFTEHLRPDPASGSMSAGDLARLCAAVAQLVHGMAALHREGKLHRDIKPSNVLATPEGRVVLLDFDLVVCFMSDDGASHDVAGSLDYMAPEQIWGRPLTPATDWYSLGVLLFETLSGRLPFEGSFHDMVHDKDHGAALPLRDLAPGVPPPIDDLVRALLRPDPVERPGAPEILDQLRRLADLPPSTPVRAGAALVTPFIGRAAELSALRAAHLRARADGPVVAWIEGASGMGKTELVRRFLQDLDAEADRPLVLRGACHPQEAVPYKAFDGIVDSLGRYLVALPPGRAVELLPERPAALARLFPTLARVPDLAATDPSEPALEPQELRARAFRAFRALLARLRAHRPLVVWIDDMQWGDADSAALFRELLRPPDPPAILWLLAHRAEDRDLSPLLRALRADDAVLAAHAVSVSLAPLNAAERAALADRLLASAAFSRTAELPAATELLEESAGSPLFLTEVIRHLAESPPSDRRDLSIEHRLRQILLDRIERLSDEPRRLLEIVAVAGRPLDRALALRAAGVGEAGRVQISRLSHAVLLRPTALDERPAVVTYHERVREVVLAALPPERLREHHARLAALLRAMPSPDPEALLEHALGAGDEDTARRDAAEAAARAARVLAFDRAAALYRTALALTPPDASRWPLTLALAEALAHAGRGRDAAMAFEGAAAELEAPSPAPDLDGAAPPAPDPIDLRRRAAEQYLRSGHIPEGIAALTCVLAALELEYPRTPARAGLMALRDRARLRLRGLHVDQLPASARSPRALARADACWSAGLGLAWVDRIRTAAFQARYALLALDSGEPGRAACALATEASQRASLGGAQQRRACADILTRAARLAERGTDPYHLAFVGLMDGTIAFYEASWRRAHGSCRRALTLLRERCRGVAWEMTTAHLLSLASLAYLGDMAALRAALPDLLDEASQRGDRLAAASLATGIPNLAWLAADDPAEARRRACEAISHWSQSDFQVQHYFDLLAQCHIDLYERAPGAALRRLLDAWPRVWTSFSLLVQNFRVTLWHLRARVALAAAQPGGMGIPSTRPRRGAERAALLALALHDERRLAGEDVSWAPALAAGLRAGRLAAQGRRAEAEAAYARAAELHSGADMALHAAAARLQAARLRGGEAGRAAGEEAARRMRTLGVVNPERMADLLMPGPPVAPG